MTVQVHAWLLLLQTVLAVLICYIVNDGVLVPMYVSSNRLDIGKQYSPFTTLLVHLASFASLFFAVKSFINLYNLAEAYSLAQNSTGDNYGKTI